MTGFQFRNWTLGNLFWWASYVCIFLAFRSEGGAWRFFWMTIWSLIVICCSKQIVMLLFHPPEELKGDDWREFRWRVAITRAMGVMLILTGALWTSGKHKYSDAEPNFDFDFPDFGPSHHQTGFALSIASGSVGISWLLPLGVLLAAYPFSTIQQHDYRIGRACIKCVSWIAVTIVFFSLHQDSRLIGPLILIAVNSLDLAQPNCIQGFVVDRSAVLKEMGYSSLASLGFVIVAALLLLIPVRTGPWKSAKAVFAATLISVAIWLLCRVRLELFPSLTPTFQSMIEPRLLSSWLIVGFVIAICSWLIAQIAGQKIGARVQTIRGMTAARLTLPPVILFVLGVYLGFKFFFTFLNGIRLSNGGDSNIFFEFAQWYGKLDSKISIELKLNSDFYLQLIYTSILIGLAFWGRTIRIRPEPLYEVRRLTGESMIVIWFFTPLVLTTGSFAIGQYLETGMLMGTSFSILLPFAESNWPRSLFLVLSAALLLAALGIRFGRRVSMRRPSFSSHQPSTGE